MREQYRLISIIRNVEAEHVCAIVEVLLREGVRCLEVSLSEPVRGFACLQAIRQRFGGEDLLVGAGTVSVPDEVDRLKSLGVSFFRDFRL